MHVLVFGGAGYIGGVLVPALLNSGHRVTVFDALFFGTSGLAGVQSHPGFSLIRGDIRDRSAVVDALSNDVDAVIYLAGVSNHPCCEIDAELTTAINKEATGEVMTLSKEYGVPRFLFASSASVYGVRSETSVVESLPLAPITLYAQYKAWAESRLSELASSTFCPVMLRAGTVMGYSPRLRLDLTAHILATAGLTTGVVHVWGGQQRRPHVDIRDLVALYCQLLTAPKELVSGRAFNVVAQNFSVLEIAQSVASLVGDVEIIIEPAVDYRSYHLDGSLAQKVLGFKPTGTLAMAVKELSAAFGDDRVLDPTDARFRNIDWMERYRDDWNWKASCENT